MKKNNNITTSKLLTVIRDAYTFEEVLSGQQPFEEPVFNDVLYKMLQDRGMTAKDMICESRIDRSYFYHILSGVKLPGRNMVLRIGLCLHVSLDEMNHLLMLAGAGSLYPRIRRDAVLIFAIQKKYSMDQTNEMLIRHGEDPLFIVSSN